MIKHINIEETKPTELKNIKIILDLEYGDEARFYFTHQDYYSVYRDSRDKYHFYKCYNDERKEYKTLYGRQCFFGFWYSNFEYL